MGCTSSRVKTPEETPHTVDEVFADGAATSKLPRGQFSSAGLNRVRSSIVRDSNTALALLIGATALGGGMPTVTVDADSISSILCGPDGRLYNLCAPNAVTSTAADAPETWVLALDKLLRADVLSLSPPTVEGILSALLGTAIKPVHVDWELFAEPDMDAAELAADLEGALGQQNVLLVVGDNDVAVCAAIASSSGVGSFTPFVVSGPAAVSSAQVRLPLAAAAKRWPRAFLVSNTRGGSLVGPNPGTIRVTFPLPAGHSGRTNQVALVRPGPRSIAGLPSFFHVSVWVTPANRAGTCEHQRVEVYAVMGRALSSKKPSALKLLGYTSGTMFSGLKPASVSGPSPTLFVIEPPAGCECVLVRPIDIQTGNEPADAVVALTLPKDSDGLCVEIIEAAGVADAASIDLSRNARAKTQIHHGDRLFAGDFETARGDHPAKST